jgi:hypothetical protein
MDNSCGRPALHEFIKVFRSIINERNVGKTC